MGDTTKVCRICRIQTRDQEYVVHASACRAIKTLSHICSLLQCSPILIADGSVMSPSASPFVFLTVISGLHRPYHPSGCCLELFVTIDYIDTETAANKMFNDLSPLTPLNSVTGDSEEVL